MIALITSVLLLFSIAGPLSADRGVGSIELSSNPRALRADGKSLATITAEVRDKEGSLVPDGTEVQFTASLGVIEDSATTASGTARAKLISADITGTCVVTASWVEGQAVAQLNVDFAEEAAAARGPEYISVDADDYVAYSIDHKVLEALGNVRIRYRSLELEAYDAQVDLAKGRIVARWQDRDHPVKIKTADGIVEGNMFSCEITGSRALLLSAKTGGVQAVDISKGLPTISAQPAVYLPDDFDMVHLADSAILVKAKGATVFPNDKILFKRANVYLEAKRTISLPNYVLSLTGYPEEGQQYVGYSTGGLTLNLPFYYALAPKSSGALLIRHNESTGFGSYGQRPGWYIDMRQKYETDRSQGMFVLGRVTSSDWGAALSHSQLFGNQTSGYLFLDYPAHESFYGQLNLNRAFNGFSAGIDLFGNRDGGLSLSGDFNIRTNARPIGKTGLRYALSTRLERLRTPALTDSNQRLEGSVFSAPWQLGSSLSLRTSAGLGYVWGRPEIQGLSTSGAAVMDWKLAKYSNLQLNYRFSDKPNVFVIVRQPDNPQEEIRREIETKKQTLSASLRLGDESKWHASLYGIKGLDDPTMSIFGDISYRLSSVWRLGLRSTFNRYRVREFDSITQTFFERDRSYNDLEVSVGHPLGNRELIAVWSQSEHKIMFELGSGGF